MCRNALILWGEIGVEKGGVAHSFTLALILFIGIETTASCTLILKGFMALLLLWKIKYQRCCAFYAFKSVKQYTHLRKMNMKSIWLPQKVILLTIKYQGQGTCPLPPPPLYSPLISSMSIYLLFFCKNAMILCGRWDPLISFKF